MTGRLLCLAHCLFLVGWSAVAGAGSTTAQAKCVELTRSIGGEKLVNGCGNCRLVSVERSRPGANFPTVRTITVPDKTRQALPFRGPGHTRITGESACPGSADDWQGNPAARSPECIQFGQTYDGTAVLVNPCVECRTAAVERIDLAGNLSFRSYPVAPKSTVDLPTDGLARARIVRDDPCG
jgi:hypothetical protein